MMFCDSCGREAKSWVYQHYFCEYHDPTRISRCLHCEKLGVTDSRNPYIQCYMCIDYKLPLQEKPGK